jgi:hypothetical protein
MTKPVEEWDEEYLLSLPLENDTLERKGSTLLDLTLPQANQGKVLLELAKQLSAFANTGGGRIVYGLTDKGEVDSGGVCRSFRGRRPTKEWLEDLIPTLTDNEIVGVNVYEITGKEADSKIQPGRALYVVDIPDSERAPHQSKKDFKYYVRLGGKSEPASHRLIEDIRNRARHPFVTMIRGEIVSLVFPRESLPKIFGLLRARVNFVLSNRGRIKAANTCVLLMGELVQRGIENVYTDTARVRPGPTSNSFFIELQHPIYPDMETLLCCELRLHIELSRPSPQFSPNWYARDCEGEADGLTASWKIFADNAPPTSGTLALRDMNFRSKAIDALRGDAAWEQISSQYGIR